jgi:hypothetical protein
MAPATASLGLATAGPLLGPRATLGGHGWATAGPWLGHGWATAGPWLGHGWAMAGRRLGDGFGRWPWLSEGGGGSQEATSGATGAVAPQ